MAATTIENTATIRYEDELGASFENSSDTRFTVVDELGVTVTPIDSTSRRIPKPGKWQFAIDVTNIRNVADTYSLSVSEIAPIPVTSNRQPTTNKSTAATQSVSAAKTSAKTTTAKSKAKTKTTKKKITEVSKASSLTRR